MEAFKMFLLLMLEMFSITMASSRCDRIYCSNIVDRVCAMSKAWDGTVVVSTHHNICHLNKIKCRLEGIAEVNQIPITECSNEIPKSSRRVNDFSIVGAYQTCNHTCPTYCVDTYEPVCAQIWRRGKNRYDLRPMVNHCHIDLFSCAVGVNVTIKPLGSCYNNASGLLYMNQMASLKSLGLLEPYDPSEFHNAKPVVRVQGSTRRYSGVDNTERELEHILRHMIKKSLLKKLKM